MNDQIYEEGKKAFHDLIGADNSPYAFFNTEYWASRNYRGFETMRWKLDAWMRGWIDARDASRKSPVPVRSSARTTNK